MYKNWTEFMTVDEGMMFFKQSQVFEDIFHISKDKRIVRAIRIEELKNMFDLTIKINQEIYLNLCE